MQVWPRHEPAVMTAEMTDEGMESPLIHCTDLCCVPLGVAQTTAKIWMSLSWYESPCKWSHRKCVTIWECQRGLTCSP